MGFETFFNNDYQDRVLNLIDEKTLKDTKRHEQYIIKCEKTEYNYINNRLFNLAWNNHRCCHLKSVGRKITSKLGFKPF